MRNVISKFNWNYFIKRYSNCRSTINQNKKRNSIRKDEQKNSYLTVEISFKTLYDSNQTSTKTR